MKPAVIFSTLLLAFATVRAEEKAVPEKAGKHWIRIVGVGGGFEAGNGLHLGLARGKNKGQLGLGLIYDDQNAEFNYSAGLRFLRTLYTGRINDTYAWTGAGIQGHSRKGDRGYLGAGGAGVGISVHFGLPFHLSLDSGWDAYYESQSVEREIWFGPTLNGALVYEW